MTLRRWLSACAALLLGACAALPDAGPDMAAAQQLLGEPTDRMIVVAIPNPTAGVPLQAGSTLSHYAAAQRYAVSTSARETLRAIEREHGLKERIGWPIRALGLHCAVLEIAAGASRDAVIAALAQDRRVEIVQPLLSFDTLASPTAGTYNDPYVNLQLGFIEIDAAQAHRTSRGAGVLVAVIDTGVDTGHPDLQGRVGLVRNFVDSDPAAFQRDQHGTQVAGIIAAVADNKLGIVGVAPESRLALYKACRQRTSDGASARCTTLTLALALAAAIDDGASVINLSLGGPPDNLLARLVKHALTQGRIVVGALPPDGARTGFPAGIEGVIAVDVAGRPSTGRSDRDVLRAPGQDILTLVPGGRYDFESGSSLAAAHVSAAAALLLGADPRLPAATVRALLMRSQGQTSPNAPINACGALAELQAHAPCAADQRALARESGPRDARSLR